MKVLNLDEAGAGDWMLFSGLTFFIMSVPLQLLLWGDLEKKLPADAEVGYCSLEKSVTMVIMEGNII